MRNPFNQEFPPPHVRGAFGPWARGGFGEFPPGWGPGGRGRGGHGPHRRGGGRRGRRGDVRAAILALLTEQSPRHGYEIIREIAERSDGLWRPSPGSVYPTLQLLTDEGLVISKEEGGKRLFELTEAGQEAAKAHEGAPPWEQIADDADPDDLNLRKAGGPLLAAIMQVAQAGTPSQKAKAIEVLNEARRSIYAILGEIEEASDEDAE
ncbi:PadR family transcriptional regulator [Amycolatopsis sp. CA-230715]|uniref:PadR family transcriptional regulator n=1 Tax=Amycolatopsis sp. CA-230715 TaxID=2745196 RepID=UPI001C02A525|nr:PadR family transcriptional regulator [Amycolatopsis sp. CA-230715]QWF82964.1 hypothetical protein HUW46_06403 [Amycolatopsis sp. CA-230715]